MRFICIVVKLTICSSYTVELERYGKTIEYIKCIANSLNNNNFNVNTIKRRYSNFSAITSYPDEILLKHSRDHWKCIQDKYQIYVRKNKTWIPCTHYIPVFKWFNTERPSMNAPLLSCSVSVFSFVVTLSPNHF